MISKISARFGTVFLAAGLCIALTAPAGAETTADNGMMPPMAASAVQAPAYDAGDQNATHPMLRMTPEKSEIIHLDEEASSIIVGNPQNLNVVLETPRTIILTPRQPGATHFLVMNKSGKVLMARHVIVASPKEKYVRIRRSCINATSSCQDTRVYYCPGGMCHETGLLPGSNSNTSQYTISAEPRQGAGEINPEGEETPAESRADMIDEIRNICTENPDLCSVDSDSDVNDPNDNVEDTNPER
ncbi:MAG: pilus assembly protein N-terminal domain-containing protein [Micavibrio aeruginosavorus]|uniref:Pilus assembly protein N-terminal domain-containing protein n=1 Tax=Micavibrio aeruginosavorus TaxID=349221 RepID=A0A7T5R3P5_9BACT|nr:MAG: pilus assembly protein N-terminal domain-containing protein [Micavibrio aeruginosavorus]